CPGAAAAVNDRHDAGNQWTGPAPREGTMRIRWRLGMLAISLGSACVGGEGDVETGEVTQSLTAVTWTDTVGVTANGNDLTKTSTQVGWNAGAVSVESLN